ncbi:MAG: hypothetical protein L0271_25805 [Gemmatimonadetes bacterium]|nr:hypothetical protein [Gemmatimonadota bacterium]
MSVFPGPEEAGIRSSGSEAPRADPIPRGPAAGEAGPGAPPDDPEVAALRLAFAPLHKRAFGMAVGTAFGVFLFAFTAFHLIAQPEEGLRIELLRAYFYGYEASWKGAIIGAAWGFGVGFVMGWFIAFCRNLVIAISVFLTRTRAEMQQTREFLDHI